MKLVICLFFFSINCFANNEARYQDAAKHAVQAAAIQSGISEQMDRKLQEIAKENFNEKFLLFLHPLANFLLKQRIEIRYDF